jgi:hypothetical protein
VRWRLRWQQHDAVAEPQQPTSALGCGELAGFQVELMELVGLRRREWVCGQSGFESGDGVLGWSEVAWPGR